MSELHMLVFQITPVFALVGAVGALELRGFAAVVLPVLKYAAPVAISFTAHCASVAVSNFDVAVREYTARASTLSALERVN